MKAKNKVFILIIEHRHGTDVWAHSTREKAEESLEKYVMGWWEEEMDSEMPTEMQMWDKITEYFDKVENENWRITELEIDEFFSF